MLETVVQKQLTVWTRQAGSVCDWPRSDRQLVSGFQNICLQEGGWNSYRGVFPLIVHEKQDRVGVSETDQEEMSLLSTWDYNADEFHILVRECFLFRKEKEEKFRV